MPSAPGVAISQGVQTGHPGEAAQVLQSEGFHGPGWPPGPAAWSCLHSPGQGSWDMRPSGQVEFLLWEARLADTELQRLGSPEQGGSLGRTGGSTSRMKYFLLISCLLWWWASQEARGRCSVRQGSPWLCAQISSSAACAGDGWCLAVSSLCVSRTVSFCFQLRLIDPSYSNINFTSSLVPKHKGNISL